jgi:hypothetical protein
MFVVICFFDLVIPGMCCFFDLVIPENAKRLSGIQLDPGFALRAPGMTK